MPLNVIRVISTERAMGVGGALACLCSKQRNDCWQAECDHQTLGRLFGWRTTWSGSRSAASPEKVTNVNGSSAGWQQASAAGSQKLWKPVIPLSAAFTEAIHNEANIF